MEAWFLREWQRKSAWQLVLRPFSWAFAILIAMRKLLFRVGLLRQWRAPVPIIIVGNLSVGGTGKTPLVIALCEALQERGIAVGVVSRGYSRDSAARNEPVVIGTSPKGAREFISDETELIARRSGVPIGVHRDRARAVRALLSAHPSLQVVISDDGLQHYALARDFEIVVVDGTRGFGNQLLLPAGPLREPVRRLKQVDAVVINRTMSHHPKQGTDVEALFSKVSKAPVYSMVFGRERFRSLREDRQFTPEQMRQHCAGKSCVAMAGIGNPHRFFLHLTAIGLSLSSRRALPDHHSFSREDFGGLDDNVVVIMTEKDAVKCERLIAETPSTVVPEFWCMQIDAMLPESLLSSVEDLTRSHHQPLPRQHVH